MHRGQTYLARNDYSRALLEFRNATRQTPRDPEPYYQVGMTFSALGDIPNAVANLRKAVELNPGFQRAQTNLAAMLIASANPQAVELAKRGLEGMLASGSRDPGVLDSLAQADLLLGRTQDAQQLLEENLAQSPRYLGSSLRLARLKIAANDRQGAEKILNESVRQDPKSADAALSLAQLYIMEGKIPEAEEQLQRAVVLDPKHVPALITMAAIHIERKQVDAAAEVYRTISLLPDKRTQHLYGVFLFQHNQRDAAIREFERLAKTDPGDRAGRTRLVTAYVLTGNRPAARQLLGRALKGNARDIDALLQRSRLELLDGRIQQADDDIQQVLHLNPASAEAHEIVARVNSLRGNLSNARQELGTALAQDPHLLVARLELGRSLLAGRNASAALQVIDQAPVDQRNALPLILERNWILMAEGESREFRAGIDRALSMGRGPEPLLQDAVWRMQQRDYSGAGATAREILKTDPENVRALQTLAESFAAEKRPMDALKAVGEYASQRPKSPSLQHLYGQWQMTLGNAAEARKAFLAARAADPEFAPATLALADIDLAEHKMTEARTEVSSVLAKNPHDEVSLLMLARVEEKAGNSKEAVAAYRSVVAIDPDNAPANNNLAYHLAREDARGALQYAERAVELEPANPMALDTLAWVHYQLHDYTVAVTYLKEAVAKQGSPVLQFHLGRCYIKAGDPDRGRTLLVEALRRDPSLAKSEADW